MGPVPPLRRYYEKLRLPAARPVYLLVSHSGTGPMSGGGRISQVPGEPQCVRAPFFDPGGAPFGVLPSGRKRPSASATCVLSRLNSAAHTLPVYASQRGLLPNHATLGSGWLSPLPGRVEYLLGSTKRFQLHGSILLLQASPGALSAFAETFRLERRAPLRSASVEAHVVASGSHPSIGIPSM